MNDTSRQGATSPDDYSLTIEEALTRYDHAGHPRTTRSIQRYCAKGHLDCLRQETTFGDKYLITATSVARHIAQIEELASATHRDQPRLVATSVAEETVTSATPPPPASGPDLSRQAVAENRYVERLEGEVEFLREQISTKDAQIKELSERSHETNLLIGGLQRMLAPLLGSPDPHPRNDQRDSGQIQL